MKTIVSLVSALVLTAVLSGCMAESGEATDATDHTDDLHGELSDPPVASIVVWVAGNEPMAPNGTHEVTVGMNITFDGSGSSGGNLTYAWDFGDGNSSGTIPIGAGGGGNGTGNKSSGSKSASNSSAANSTGNSTLLLDFPVEYGF